MGSVLWKL